MTVVIYFKQDVM